MSRREELGKVLKEFCPNVYFQSPGKDKMKYPCILYRRNSDTVNYADDSRYHERDSYTVTVIDPDPDSLIPAKIKTLPYTRFDRHYAAENLNHDVFNVYF